VQVQPAPPNGLSIEFHKPYRRFSGRRGAQACQFLKQFGAQKVQHCIAEIIVKIREHCRAVETHTRVETLRDAALNHGIELIRTPRDFMKKPFHREKAVRPGLSP
jgi:predicted HD phosphohydrolase